VAPALPPAYRSSVLSVARLLPAFRPVRAQLAAGVAGLLTASGAAVLAPLLVARAIDVDVASGDRRGLALRCAAYAGVLIVGWLATLGSRIALEQAAQRAMLDLKRRMFDHLVDHDVALHDRLPSGSLIGRVQGDVEALRILFVEVLLQAPADAVLLAGMFAVLAVEAPLLVAPVAGVLPVWLLLFGLFRWVAPHHFVRERAAAASTTGVLTELVRSVPALRVLGRDAWLGERAGDQVRAQTRAEIRSHLQPIWYFNAVQALRAVGTLAVLVWGAVQVSAGAATVGLVVMALGYLRQVFQPLMRLSNHLATLERARASGGRILALLDTAPTVADAPAPVPWPGMRRGLLLDRVSFAYQPDVPVLHEVTLEAPAGSRVGIVGPTGSGKSTLVDLALRFRDPVDGAVEVDGVDLRQVRLAEVRARTALVLQDVQLIPGTVLDNLGCGEAAARAALDALGVDLPLHREVRDDTLSRGERQLLTFARALARDPDLLVLDEATSAVDPATEDRVQEALERLMAGRTVLIVAHRLRTVRTCDRIYVMRDGRVVEAGSHEELVAADGEYAALVRLQAAA
jgi:ABC-type multidrug transport system fused ATPase/permease subunit